MSVSIYDVAKKAGVSVVTVSRVINGSPNVREKNKKKVDDAIRELDYKPNAAARSLANGCTGMIGMILPNVSDPFMSGVFSVVEKNLQDRGMFLVVSIASDDIKLDNSSCMRLFREERVDGILIMSPVRNEQYILELKRRNFPFVLLDQHNSDLQVPAVIVDNFYGGYQATISLIKEGAKRIAHICGSDGYESSTERLNGYKQALSDSGITFDDDLIEYGDFTVRGGYGAFERLINKGTKIDAVFAADDNTAFGVMDAAKKHGIRIPGELSIIGFDDHPFSSMLHPGLSTIRQPAEEMGSAGVELLMDIMGRKVKRATTIKLKPEVVLRETTSGTAELHYF